MTYNRHGADVLSDKKYLYTKNWSSSSPKTFRTTYDAQLNSRNQFSDLIGRTGTYRSSYIPHINTRISKDDSVIRSSSNLNRKPLYSYSSGVINSSRIQPSYLSTNRLSYQHLMDQIAQITDNVYLSSLSAITIDRIRELGITMLVSVITEPVPVRASNLENVVVAIEDSEYANLRSHLDRVIDKMHREEVRGGKILVHCFAGVSRSSSLIIAYLMKYHAMRLRQAYNHVRARRPYIQPNIGFWKQLIDFEKLLYGTASVRLLTNAVKGTVAPDVPPSALASVIFNNSQRYVGRCQRY